MMALRWFVLVCCILAVFGEEPEPPEEKRALGGLIPCPTCKRYTDAWDTFVDSFTPFWDSRADDVMRICRQRAPDREHKCRGATSSFKRYVRSVHAAWKQGSNMCKAIFPCADHIPGKEGLVKHNETGGPDGLTMTNTMQDGDACRTCMAAYDGVVALEAREFDRMYDICTLAMGSDDAASCEALLPIGEANDLPSAEVMCMEMGMCSGFPMT